MAKKTPTKKLAPKSGDILPASKSVNRNVFELTVNPAPRAQEAIELREKATTLVIVDKASHIDALKLLKGGKTIIKDIKAHWATLKRPVSDLLAHVRNLEAGELEPGEVGIKEIERKVGVFERAEEARVAEENRIARARADEEARLARQKELDDAEAAALEAEAASEGLSQRESDFTELVARGTGAVSAAEAAGYANPVKQAERLMNTPKIVKAIDGLKAAALIRQQAGARAQQPIIATVEDAKPELGRVAGLSKRTYYSCDSANIVTMLAAFKRGELTAEAFLPNMPFLNKEAGRIKDAAMFAQVYPGCTLTSRDGHAG